MKILNPNLNPPQFKYFLIAYKVFLALKISPLKNEKEKTL